VTGKIYALPKGGNGKGGKPDGGDPVAPVDRTARFDRPVPIGVSTGHPAITAGTIGCRVTGGGSVYALSNNHVYADENQASIGDAVIQPGAFDGGSSPADDIGTLSDFQSIVFSTSADNVIDAAIAVTTTGDLGNSTPLGEGGGYGIPSSTTLSVVEIADKLLNNQAVSVQKYGRTTGLTKGQVAWINATVNVGYDSGTARFVNQIVISPGSFSGGGDSGSLVVTDDDNRNPVGLLFAGSVLYTIANPIDAVLSRFGVTVDGEDTSGGGDGGGGEASTVSVASITYSGEGGKNNDKHLNVTVALVNDLGNPVAGASVSILLVNTTTGRLWAGDGTTSGGGTVTFTLKNAPSGHYETIVMDVVAAGLTWDGVPPPNGYDKP
jgi:hypothetical protein